MHQELARGHDIGLFKPAGLGIETALVRFFECFSSRVTSMSASLFTDEE